MTYRRTRCLPALLLLAISFGTDSRTHGDDWPQVLGPDRNGVVPGDGFELSGKPRRVWSHRVGQGFAGPAVVGRHVFVFHRVDDVERLEAVDRETGKPVWTADFPAFYRGGFNPDHGPRSVPLVHDGTVVVFGAAGNAHAVSQRSGKKLWSRDLFDDYDAQDGYFGAGSSPIVVGDRILFNVGGKQDAGFVALKLADGTTVWNSTGEGASYSSPVMIQHHGTSCVVFVARFNVVGIDPKDGKVKFRRPFGQRGPTVNAASPVVFNDHLFLTASYGIGAILLNLEGPELTNIWSNDDSMSSQYNTPIYYNGHLYGIHGREDVGSAELRCIEAMSGRVVWSRRNFGVANLNRVGNKLVALTSEGTLVSVMASADQYSQIASSKITSGSTRALPAFSRGQMFFRDNQANAGELACLEWSEN